MAAARGEGADRDVSAGERGVRANALAPFIKKKESEGNDEYKD